jgi:hypothetical protein
MVVLDSSPRASVVMSVGSRRGWRLLMGYSSLLDVVLVPWGRASALAGVAPEALQERGCSCKVFSPGVSVCGC